jgi:hypothetical protein
MSSNQGSQNANSLVERMTQAVKNAHVAIQVLKKDNEALKAENDKLKKEIESLKKDLGANLKSDDIGLGGGRILQTTVEKDSVRLQKGGKKGEQSRCVPPTIVSCCLFLFLVPLIVFRSLMVSAWNDTNPLSIKEGSSSSTFAHVESEVTPVLSQLSTSSSELFPSKEKK